MHHLDADRLLRRAAVARLVVAALLWIGIPVIPGELMPGRQGGMLVLTLVAVLATSAPVVVFRFAKPARVAWLTCLLDVVLITAVVAATGAARSIFVFLYVLAVMMASLLLSRAGTLTVAAGSSLLYTGLIFGRTVFPFAYLLQPPEETTSLEVLSIFLNAGTLLVVGVVAGGLAERIQATRRELESRGKDLRDLQAFRDVVMRSVGAGLVASDGAHTITAVNAAAEAIAGRPRADAIGRPWSALFGDRVSLASVEADIRDNPRHSPRHETTVRRPDGIEVPVRLTFSALSAEDGAVLGLVAVCEDLSEIREMEARMREADRLATVGRMAANIAHEIRNPLAAVTGAVEALNGDRIVGEARERLARIVLSESQRLNEIIKDFLAYARPAPMTVADTDVAQLLREVLALLQDRETPPALKVALDLPDTLPWKADAPQLRQAFWNVCLNALEAMPDGGELRVAAVAAPGRLRVSVSDTGAGIDAAARPHVFEPFYSTKSGSSGLGLALVHRVVRDHGGTVEIRGAAAGGTTVVLTLPRAAS